MIPEWECVTVLAESNTPTPTQTIDYQGCSANKERWGMGCDITV